MILRSHRKKDQSFRRRSSLDETSQDSDDSSSGFINGLMGRRSHQKMDDYEGPDIFDEGHSDDLFSSPRSKRQRLDSEQGPVDAKVGELDLEVRGNFLVSRPI